MIEDVWHIYLDPPIKWDMTPKKGTACTESTHFPWYEQGFQVPMGWFQDSM